ncbi:hypothetical protein ACR79P_08350 [Sphingobacterium spiritivorum]|uniref:hypothetical protein n=1 Tax=Sphingobacterium spiritivorum TaxID=258 RepID=UPI003DA4FA17
MYIPNQTEYDRLQAFARKVDYSIALDLVHDSILISTSFEDCLKKICGRKYYYFTCNIIPESPKVIAEKQCRICKEVLPECMFPRLIQKGKVMIPNRCKACRAEYTNMYYDSNVDQIKEYQKKYYLDNKENRKAYVADYYQRNKDKKREYNRKYRAIQKLKKQNQSN